MNTRLDKYLNNYTSFNDWLIKKRYEKLSRYYVGESCLELGVAEGTGTKLLIERFEKITIVDGSKKAIEKIRAELKSDKLECIVSYFENMKLESKYDTIILAHILEHVDDPIVVLKKAKEFLNKDGVIIIDVPNANSIHRQVGVKLGMLGKVTDLNEADHSIGHQRVYTPETLQQDIKKCDLKIKRLGGMLIKTLSNSQMELVFNNDQLEALFDIGEVYLNISAEIFAVCVL